MLKLEIKCEGAGVLSFDKVIKMQNDLKYLDPISYEKLKKNLLKNGISQPLQIWKDESKKKYYLLDGHQRLETLIRMKAEGIEIPKEIPVSYTQAKDKKDAFKKLVGLASNYGKTDKERFMRFIEDNSLELKEISEYVEFPEINLESLVFSQEEPEIEANGEEIASEYGKQEVLIFYFDTIEAVDKVKKYFEASAKVIDGKLLIDKLGIK